MHAESNKRDYTIGGKIQCQEIEEHLQCNSISESTVQSSRERNVSLSMADTDSFLLRQCIRGERKIPWKICNHIKEIQKLVEIHGVTIKHYCLKEAKKPPDKWSALSHGLDEDHVYNSFSEMRQEVRGLINMDKWDLPSFKSRRTKYNII